MKKRTFNTGISCLLLGLSAGLPVSSMAETVTLPSSAQAAEEYSVQVPGRGMNMEAVEESFGTPLEKVDAVGEPPISRWVYHKFTVYFEHNFVIHSVVNN